MANGWESVHGAVSLGTVQEPLPAISIAPDAPVEPKRNPVLPEHRGAVRAGGIRLRAASGNVATEPFAPVSVLDDNPVIAVGTGALTPGARLDIPAGGVALGSAPIERDWKAFAAEYSPHSPELQPSPEPRKIWNRVALSLPECVLGGSGILPAAPGVAADRQTPEEPQAVPPETGVPHLGSLEVLAGKGLPREPERHIRQEQYTPASAIREPRHIGPKVRVPLPDVPRVR